MTQDSRLNQVLGLGLDGEGEAMALRFMDLLLQLQMFSPARITRRLQQYCE